MHVVAVDKAPNDGTAGTIVAEYPGRFRPAPHPAVPNGQGTAVAQVQARIPIGKPAAVQRDIPRGGVDVDRAVASALADAEVEVAERHVGAIGNEGNDVPSCYPDGPGGRIFADIYPEHLLALILIPVPFSRPHGVPRHIAPLENPPVVSGAVVDDDAWLGLNTRCSVGSAARHKGQLRRIVGANEFGIVAESESVEGGREDGILAGSAVDHIQRAVVPDMAAFHIDDIPRHKGRRLGGVGR